MNLTKIAYERVLKKRKKKRGRKSSSRRKKQKALFKNLVNCVSQLANVKDHELIEGEERSEGAHQSWFKKQKVNVKNPLRRSQQLRAGDEGKVLTFGQRSITWKK